MHCVPGQPLPEDLSSWLDGGGVGGGVIYFSLGSVAKGVTMPDKYLRLFIETFSRLKYRVIWKYESKIEGISNNVFIKDWLPQQDILGRLQGVKGVEDALHVLALGHSGQDIIDVAQPGNSRGWLQYAN
nr:UDP-glucosyltransferase 2-like [Cherax quadricarinatus]